MNLSSILYQEKLLEITRSYFQRKKFHEVIPTILNTTIPIEANIHSFSTIHHSLNKNKAYFLPTSPEKALKNALSLGIGNCFAVGNCFRDLEQSGTLHFPEFLMLEWYRVNSDYQEIIKEVQDYIVFAVNTMKTSLHIDNWKILSLQTLFKDYAGIDYLEILTDENTLFEKAAMRGYAVKDATWRELFDQIFVNEIESRLPKSPLFIIDYPSCISPLCKKKKDNPLMAERFELYINGIELANGNTENTDYEAVEHSLEAESKLRLNKNKTPNPPLDTDFIQSLKKMKETGNQFAGVGLGIDRLIMLLKGYNT